MTTNQTTIHFANITRKGRSSFKTYQRVSIERSFYLVNNYSLGIEMAVGLNYESGLPGDSIPYIVEYLNAKDYINSHGFAAVEGTSVYIHPQTRVLTLFVNLWDMTIERQQDWLETISVLRLTETQSPKIFVLIVPNGQEKELVTAFESLDEV